MKKFLCLMFFVLALVPFEVVAAGLDSEGNELPMHANSQLVATLKADNGGTFEVANLLDAKGLISANAGAKIGQVGNNADTNCVANQAGVIRYNSDSGNMQYCNGKTLKWSAAFGGGENNGGYVLACPGVLFLAQKGNYICYVDYYESVHTYNPKCQLGNIKTGDCSCPDGSSPTPTAYSVDQRLGQLTTFVCQ